MSRRWPSKASHPIASLRLPYVVTSPERVSLALPVALILTTSDERVVVDAASVGVPTAQPSAVVRGRAAVDGADGPTHDSARRRESSYMPIPASTSGSSTETTARIWWQ